MNSGVFFRATFQIPNKKKSAEFLQSSFHSQNIEIDLCLLVNAEMQLICSNTKINISFVAVSLFGFSVE